MTMTPVKKTLIPLAAFGLAALPAACAVAQSPTIPAAAPSKTGAKAPAKSQRQVIFDKVWTTVRDRHYDPTLGGLDWIAVKRKYLPLALRAGNDGAFYATLNQMLGELKQSHLGAIPPQEITPADGGAGGSDEREGSGGETGITALLVGGKALITRVAEGSPAEKAGIRPGEAGPADRARRGEAGCGLVRGAPPAERPGR
jgi:carboxyl-terminal processing protease